MYTSQKGICIFHHNIPMKANNVTVPTPVAPDSFPKKTNGFEPWRGQADEMMPADQMRKSMR